uniref:Uncharacterized protein n=1 Tax=Brassica oleracea TaxID=3712 RepID=A0A3P6E7R8_BRAOL|nr:unnamed protein product [Brassica oleracea]
MKKGKDAPFRVGREGPLLACQVSRDERMFRRLRVRRLLRWLSSATSRPVARVGDISSGGSRRRHLLRWLYSATSLSKTKKSKAEEYVHWWNNTCKSFLLFK